MSKRVTCKSGIEGGQGRLRKNYSSYAEFCNYCTTYKLHQKLGYQTPMTCWKANPIIQWSVNPDDFRKAPKQKLCSHPKNKPTS